MKLGAVMIPTSPRRTAGDLRDRLERGAVRHVLVSSEQTAKFAGLSGLLLYSRAH